MTVRKQLLFDTALTLASWTATCHAALILSDMAALAGRVLTDPCAQKRRPGHNKLVLRVRSTPGKQLNLVTACTAPSQSAYIFTLIKTAFVGLIAKLFQETLRRATARSQQELLRSLA